jgi:lipopolysaccharide export system permease protein
LRWPSVSHAGAAERNETMNLLKRYIFSSFARIFFLSLAAFVGVYLLIDFFEKVDDFIEHQARLSLYFLYFFNKIPLIVTQVTPLAVLMGVFLTLGGFSYNNELTAMRSCGISLWQISAPLLGVSLLIALASLTVNEYLIPLSAKKTNHILRTEVKGKPEPALKRDRLWIREEGAIINIRIAHPEKQILQGVSIFEVGKDFQLCSRTDATQAIYSEGGWTFEELTVRDFSPASGELISIEQFPEKRMKLKKTPDDFKMVEQNNEEMGFQDLRNLSRKLQAEGYDATRYRVDMHARLAMPFASVIMAFLGIPFALRKGRSSGLALGIAVSVAIGIAYYILQAMLLAFGYSSVVPPLIAAWSANLFFGLLGIWLLLSARE